MDGDILYLALIILFIIVCYLEKTMVLYVIGGITIIFCGFYFMSSYFTVSLLVVITGVYELIRGLFLAIEAGGTARGWSQFRGIYEAMKERFKG